MGLSLTRVILVRHASTDWNQVGRFTGRSDIPLSDQGLREAGRVASRLREEAVAAAYASDLIRARRTAEIALAGHEVALTLAPELREAGFGAWERLTYEQIAVQFPQEWAAWTENPVQVSPPGGGESMGEVRDRVVTFFESVLLPPPRPVSGGEGAVRSMIFVSHGGPIRALITHLLDVPLERFWRFTIAPASISIFDLYPEGALAAVIGDTSHLDGLQGGRA